MLSVALAVVVVGIPLTVAALGVLLQMRANDKRAADRHAQLVLLLARPAEVSVSPDSSRVPSLTGSFPIVSATLHPLGLSATERAAVVAFFAPTGGPRTAAECADAIGRELVPDDELPEARPWWAMSDAIYYRPGAGDERMLLEAVVATYLLEAGARGTDEDTRLIASALTRPTVVRPAATR